MMSDSANDCDQLFVEFLARLERGERTSIHDLCGQFPGYAPELRHRYDAWRALTCQRAKQQLTDESVETSACGRDDPAWVAFFESMRRTPNSHARFRYDGEIAKGPNGTLYRVFDPIARRPLALKRARSTSTQCLGRFFEEAQITAQLCHPNIVPVHEIGVDDEGRPYFTMRLLEGDDLKAIFDRVKRNEPGYTPSRALLLLVKVCEAMAHAHERGVIHRDLRPANIVIGRCGALYVMEWGRARLLTGPETRLPPPRPRAIPEESVTFTVEHKGCGTPDSQVLSSDGLIVGSPAYMAPEQIEGAFDSIGPCTDIYSVGAMLYELLTGEVPYCDHGSRLSPARILEAVILGDPTPIRTLKPDAPAALVAICERAMARAPEQRTTSMEVLGNEILATLETSARRRGDAAAMAPPSRVHSSLRIAGIAIIVGVAMIFLANRFVSRRSDLIAEAAPGDEPNDASAMTRAESGDGVERDLEQIEALRAEWRDLWPATLANAESMRRWIARAKEIALCRDALSIVEMREAASGVAGPSARARRDLLAAIDALTSESLGEPTIASMEDRLRCALLDPSGPASSNAGKTAH